MIKKILASLQYSAAQTGAVIVLLFQSVRGIFQRPFYLRLIVNHLYLDGFKSLPVIFLMSLFSGGVLTLQSFFGMQRVGSEIFTGAIVGITLTKELIPVLTGLMLAGRVSASYSAEIGTMVVTEQVDALFTFGINPIQYLVSPRVVALALMAPLLVLFGDFIGITGGQLVADWVCHQNGQLYDFQLFSFLEFWFVISGMIKSIFFGITVAVIGSYFGLHAEGGAKGVGRATTTAVVVSSVIILISDFFWSKILPFSLK